MTDGTDSGILTVTGRGTVVDSPTRSAVDHLFEMEKKLGQWDFLHLIVKTWANRDPELAKSYLNKSENERYRGEMLNKHAASKDLGMRKIVDLPTNLYDTIAFFYPEEIKDIKFLTKFANEFPMFRVSDSII